MSKATITSIIQAVLSAIGALLIGKNIFGLPIDQTWISTASGVVVGVVTLVWGFRDHTSTLEGFQAGIRNLLSFLGTLLLAKGVKNDTIQAIVEAVTALLPVVYGILSRQKTAAVASGALPVTSLKQ